MTEEWRAKVTAAKNEKQLIEKYLEDAKTSFNQEIVNAVKGGAPIRQVALEAGVSRPHVYKLIERAE